MFKILKIRLDNYAPGSAKTQDKRYNKVMGIDQASTPMPPHGPLGPGLLTRGVIERHLEDIGALDRQALLDILVPHRYLPPEDPAAYIIKQHDAGKETVSGIAIKTSYDLGVAFGRSLMVKAAEQAAATLPVVSRFNEEKKRAIDDYLRRSWRTPLAKLRRYDSELSPYIGRAAELFAQRCEVVIPSKMLDGPEELLRGLHDYLSVVDLLESSSRSQTRRRLGGFMLLEPIHISLLKAKPKQHP